MEPPAQSEANVFEWRPMHAVVVLLVTAVFLYSVRVILHPFVVYVLLVFLLSPFRGTRFYVLLVGAGGVLTLVWLLNTTGSLLAPFILALGLAYVQHPLVSRMQRPWVPKRFVREGRAPTLPRGLAVMLLSLPALLGLLLIVFVGGPALMDQITGFIQGVPAMVQRGQALLGWVQVKLSTRDYPFVDEQALLVQIREFNPDQVVAFLRERQADLARRAWGAVLGVGRGVGFLLNLLSYLFLTPILTFYLLRDWDNIVGRLRDLVPDTHRKQVVSFTKEYDHLLSSYVRGQLMESAIVGVLTWLGLWAFGFPYALLLGVIAGVFNVIPYMGLIITALPGVVVALFTDNPVRSLLVLAGVFVVVQVLDGSVLGPKIVGDSVGLHPVWVILALAVCGFFFGFVGLLIAVPLAVLVKLLLARGLDRYRQSTLFRGERGLVHAE